MKKMKLLQVGLTLSIVLSQLLPATVVIAETITPTTTTPETELVAEEATQPTSSEEAPVVPEAKPDTVATKQEETSEPSAPLTDEGVEAVAEELPAEKNTRFNSPSSAVQSLLDSLTAEDLLNAVGEDGAGEAAKEETSYTEPDAVYPKVNQYIANKKLPNPTIKRDPRFGSTAVRPYKNKRPIGVVIHETANNKSTLQGEVDWMYRNKANAFVHAYTDDTQVVETAPTETLAWGAGAKANPYFIHIELVETHDFDKFARSVNNDAYWVASQLVKWGLAPSFADDNNGIGSIISHNAVSKFFGGTNHTDPIGYFAKWGYSMPEFYTLVTKKYAELTQPVTEKNISLDLSFVINKSFDTYSLPYAAPGYKVTGNTTAYRGKQVHVSREATTQHGTYYYVDSIGWVEKSALIALDTALTKHELASEAKIITKNNYFYKEPYNTMGTERLGTTTAPLYDTDVKVIGKGVKAGETLYYHIEGHGWVDYRAVSLYSDLAYDKMALDASIRIDGTYNVHTLPYPSPGLKVTGTTKPLKGKQLHVSRATKTSFATYYEVEGIGWINKNAFLALDTTLVKSTMDRDAKIATKNNYFYKEPYNTMGTERLGTTTAPLYGKDVKIIGQAKRGNAVLYYQVKGHGWVDQRAISLYPEQVYEKMNLDASIRIDGTYNLHTLPYPLPGVQVTGTTVSLKGKQLHVSRSAKTSFATYYEVEGIGWINKNAFLTLDTTLVKSTLERHAKIATKNNYFYKEPYNTMGTERLGTTTAPLYDKDVKIIGEAKRGTNVLYYHVQDHGWVDQRAINLYEKETITATSLDLSIKLDKTFNVHTLPYPYFGVKVTGTTVPLKGKQLHVSAEAKTTFATYYQVEGIGWINKNAFLTLDTTLVKETITRDATIVTKNNYFYTQPYNTMGTERIGTTTAPLYNKDVKITGQARQGKTVLYYHVENHGWVDQRAISLYEVPSYKKVNFNKSIIINQTYNVHTLPYPYFGVKVTGTTVPFKGKQVHITREATTKFATYYEVEGIGWINKGAFINLDTTVVKKTANQDAKIVTKNNYFYKEPYNTMGTERLGTTTAALYDKDVKIIGQASKGATVLYYHVEGHGWVDKRAILLYDTPNYKKVNLSGSITKKGVYNIHTLPYPYKGYKVTGTTKSIQGRSIKITREAKTSFATYYEVTGYGWINKNAISFEADKFKEVQTMLNKKYKSTNYGIQVTSLVDGSTAGINPNTRFTAASTGKLPAIYYTQKKITTGKISPKKSFQYNDVINQMPLAYGRGGAGVLQNQAKGKYFTLETILNWTIKYSDNQGTNFIAYYAADKYNATMKKEISGIIGRNWDSPFSITAKENALLMEAIYKQGGQVMGYLQNTMFDNQRIPKYLPVKVGHKIGDVYDNRHDVAIVYADKPYILSVMTKNYTSYETISKMSLDVYNILK